ncbi:hypothetical protein [Saccharopolyspora gregorii]|uniref:hypothetical protein n=1 Tax=Saccharopolyspora gregorii TaxID=33914 RepID=UPI0021AC4279|nr:hypothetical protein [Saccharopolyspora gregorii]
MAKQAFPGVQTGGIMPKLIGAAVTFAVLVLIVKHPAESAVWVKGAFELFIALVNGMAQFFQGLMA